MILNENILNTVIREFVCGPDSMPMDAKELSDFISEKYGLKTNRFMNMVECFCIPVSGREDMEPVWIDGIGDADIDITCRPIGSNGILKRICADFNCKNVDPYTARITEKSGKTTVDTVLRFIKLMIRIGKNA